MKVEAWIFVITTIFFAVVTPAYWFITNDWTGSTALACTMGLALIIAGYLGYHATRMDARPEDRKEAEIAEGAGELGFFPPYSWWPLWASLTLSIIVFGFAMSAFWLVFIGFGLGIVAVSGWLFEYYRGEFAH